MTDTIIVDGLHVTAMQPASATRAPLLMVHGMFATAWPFERYQRFFSALGHPTYAMALRGHGSSRPVPDLGRVPLREFADDVATVARHVLGVAGRPVLLGHSMGGLLTQMTAARLGADVAALVLLCSAPPRGIPVLSVPLVRRMPAQLKGVLLSRPLIARRADADDLMFNCMPVEERAALYDAFVPESGRAGRELAIGTEAVSAAEIRCPVLSVGAEDDRTVPVSISGRIARKYGGTHLTFTRHAHFILLEPDWETPARAIAGWIESATA